MLRPSSLLENRAGGEDDDEDDEDESLSHLDAWFRGIAESDPPSQPEPVPPVSALHAPLFAVGPKPKPFDVSWSNFEMPRFTELEKELQQLYSSSPLALASRIPSGPDPRLYAHVLLPAAVSPPGVQQAPEASNRSSIPFDGTPRRVLIRPRKKARRVSLSSLVFSSCLCCSTVGLPVRCTAPHLNPRNASAVAVCPLMLGSACTR